MILGITGHRKLSNNKFIYDEFNKNFISLKVDKVIVGMAPGSDQIAAKVCIDLKIPFIAAIPFKGQEFYWTSNVRKEYFDLLDCAEEVKYISRGGFANWKYQARNQYIVDNSDKLLAVLKLNTKFGGTFNCIQYAKEKKKEIIIIDPD